MQIHCAPINYLFIHVCVSFKFRPRLTGREKLITFPPKLQALVYDILPSTTAVFSYAIGSRKLSANEHFFFLWCSNSGKFVTNDSNKTRRVIYSRLQS